MLSAKQASLPLQRAGRRSQTPVQSTPRNSNGSAKRHRSLSAPRSTGAPRSTTPKTGIVTPRSGKRKRGASAVAAPEHENEEEDELSPDRVENVASVEKSRRAARTVSPIREEPNEAPDELSIIEEAHSTVRKPPPPGDVTGLLSNNVGASADIRRIGARRSRSTDVVPVTPGMQSSSNIRQSFALSTTVENTVSNASQAEDDDTDELSPPQNAAITPRVVSRESMPNDTPLEGEDGGIDELSPARGTILDTTALETTVLHSENATTPLPARSVARGRSRKTNGMSENSAAATPVVRKPVQRKSRRSVVGDESSEEQPDELSPVTQKLDQVAPEPARPMEEEEHTSDDESEAYEELLEPDEPVREPTPKAIAKRTVAKQVQRAKPATDSPPRKRQKTLGPKLSISVMRVKGYGVRGITVADTTRTIIEETIDHRLSKMLEKLQTALDSSSRKELRSEVNLALSFKESLNEKLLDLQDANDVLTTNLKKLRIFKRDNAELRKDILALQNNRQQIALEHDDVQAEHESEKARIEFQNTLSTNMFDIEAAVQNGRKKAKAESREDEGPDIPLSMLLETVSRNVGSVGGGLLAKVKSFNTALERAAGWLEGRV